MKELMVFAAIVLLLTTISPSYGQQEGFIGEIRMFAGNFAPRGWALCEGQLLSVSQNQALFSILGTTYGGDGRTTFALPDLRGRVVIHPGQGPGLSSHRLGEKGGQENVTLTVDQMPSHTHKLDYSFPRVDSENKGAAMALPEAKSLKSADIQPMRESVTKTAKAEQMMGKATAVPSAVKPAGGDQPHDNMPPYLVINYIICVNGVYPSRQ